MNMNNDLRLTAPNSPLRAFAKPLSDEQSFTASDWDELSAWGSERVGSVTFSPSEKPRKLQSKIQVAQIGRIGISRTRYDMGIRINAEQVSGSPIVVTTNLQGHAITSANGGDAAAEGAGESAVVDLSQATTETHMSADNVQLGLIFPNQMLDEIGLSWFGNIPDRKTWQPRVGLGGVDTCWHASLFYAFHHLNDENRTLTPRNIRHIEETLASNLLKHWAAGVGVDLNATQHTITPHSIRNAESFMVEHAADAPTLSEIAKVAGVSVRTLNMNFRKFHGCTPGQFLREQRLLRAHQELLDADREEKVSDIAARLGYVHMGEFAKAYRLRFGEKPSDTLVSK